MFNQNAIARDAEALRKQIGELIGVDLTPELAVRLYEAAMGVEGMELYRVITFYAFESDRCRQSNAYFSACLMLSSAVEGLLATLCLFSEQQVEQTAIYKSIVEGDKYKEKILNATFEKYIQFAAKFGWVPSDVIAPDLLIAAVQDFPTVSRNLFPKLSEEALSAKLEAFKVEPGIEMLRFLQHMRNLVHANRWPRLGITIASPEFESDCKFVYVIAYQVMDCLFNAFSRKSRSSISKISLLDAHMGPEQRAVLSRFALDILDPKQKGFRSE
jgi:hypothetical protein